MGQEPTPFGKCECVLYMNPTYIVLYSSVVYWQPRHSSQLVSFYHPNNKPFHNSIENFHGEMTPWMSQSKARITLGSAMMRKWSRSFPHPTFKVPRRWVHFLCLSSSWSAQLKNGLDKRRCSSKLDLSSFHTLADVVVASHQAGQSVEAPMHNVQHDVLSARWKTRERLLSLGNFGESVCACYAHPM